VPGWAASRPVAAQTSPSLPANIEDAEERLALTDIFSSEQIADTDMFIEAVENAGQDPLFHQQRTRQQWVPRSWMDPAGEIPSIRSQDWSDLARLLAQLGEAALWVVVAGLLLLLIITVRRWWPWMRRVAKAQTQQPDQVHTTALSRATPLPSDLLAHARALWWGGERRMALSLLYRGSLESPGLALPASATESDCLRLSRHALAPEQHDALTQMVRVWQLAAYAGCWPGDAEFETLGGILAQRLGWPV